MSIKTNASPRSSELHALSQGKFAGIIDGVGTSAHVGLPRVRTGFPSAAGLLLAAERATDLGARRADVHIRDATIRLGQEALGLAQVVGEDGRRKTLWHVIVERDGRIQ